MQPHFSSLLLATALAAPFGLRAQAGSPSSVNPQIPDDHKAVPADSEGLPVQADPKFDGKPLPGARAGTERWIVHFKTAPYNLDAYRAEMHGGKDPAKVAQIVSDIERRMRIGRAGFETELRQLGGVMAQQWWIVNAACIEIAPGQLAAVRQLANVAYLQPDVETYPLIKTATNASNHNSDLLQANGIRGSKVGVAILDTSFDDNMNGTGKPHITFSKNGSSTVNRFCHKQKVGSRAFDDPHPHGTGVASIAAGYKWSSATADHGHANDAQIAAFSIANTSTGNSSTSTMATAYNAIAAIAAQCKVVSSNLSYSGSPNPLSVEQKAMDNLALQSDIVNATAAGNSGSSVSSSLANINGLSVAAVSENAHALASFSSRGFQSGRYFPNISANGVSTNMAQTNNESTDYVGSGTSMASPQVCGGAALVRDANTALKADETIAILLASTEANTGSASTIKVNGVGAGYMRLDKARTLATNAAGHGRQSLSARVTTYTRTINAKANVPVQCAIKWFRHDINSTSWANLDLALLRGATVLVDSNTSSNTEEFVRFTPTQNETLTMRVTLIALGSGQSSQTFAWACEGGGTSFKPGQYITFGVGCKGSGQGASRHVIVPRAYASKLGQSANTYPHARANMRYQQVFLGSEFGGAGSFDQVCLRLDETYGGPAQSQSITVRMGHSTKTPATLGTSFAGNYTGGVTTAFSGTLNLPAHAGGGTISSWGPCIKFSTPFAYNGTQNVVIEFVNTSTAAQSWFADFAKATDATTSRAYAFSSTAATATSLFRNEGLVMCFRGAGSNVGSHTVLPSAFATKMASSANTYPHARANMRYQQVFLGTEVGSSKTFTDLCLRQDETYGGPAQAQNLRVYLGYTTRNHTNLSTTFATNADSGALSLVFAGTVNLPASTGGGGLNSWQPCVKFTTPFAWSSAMNRNFLVEIRNTSTSSQSHFEDFCSNEAGANTRRVWSTVSSTAATGSIDSNPAGLVMCFRSSSVGGASPVLGNVGVPELNKTFQITLAQARANTVALLFFGARQNIPLGACTSYASGLAILGIPTNGTGNGQITLGIPNNTALIGGKFANQFWVLDPQGALFNTFALSNGGEAEIGG